MRGRIVSLDPNQIKGIVDTRNDDYGHLTIYFGNEMPANIVVDCTVEFEVKCSRNNNYYAKFQNIVERNQAIFNTEDRNQWYEHGENLEEDFIQNCVHRIGRDIRKNPEKDRDPTVIDLMDYTESSAGEPCDLKTQNTPFFLAGRYTYLRNGQKVKYNPSYTVTFNKKDYERYRRLYPNCSIYFRVEWQQQEGYGVTVENVDGVWVADFHVMCDKIETNSVYLHGYLNRQTDDHNARDSYLFDLNDNTVFNRLL